MAKHLTESDRAEIVGIINGWPAKPRLTWEQLINRIEVILGVRPTRQTLDRHADIKYAFRVWKKTPAPTPRSQSQSEKILQQRNERLEAANTLLAAQEEILRQTITHWRYNAYRRGITLEMLTEPLPGIDRDRSDS